jgi:hypothetical protein
MGPTGRPWILSQEQYEEIIHKIQDRHVAKRPMIVFEICDGIREGWDIEMLPNTFYHFAELDARVRPRAWARFENARLQVTQEDLDFSALAFSLSARRHRAGARTFRIRVDEVTHQPWADALTAPRAN